MLYDAYQAHNDALSSLRLMAQAWRGVLDHPWAPFGGTPMVRSASAAMELLAHAGMSHERPDFGIRSVAVNGGEVPVREEVVAADPFCNLLHFRKEAAREEPVVLVVAPLSGHFATLLRGTVATLLADHDVYLTDWINARNVPIFTSG